MAEKNDQGNWGKLFSEMWRRITRPFKEPPFIFYFLIIVIVIGGFGVLIPIGKLFFVENNEQNLMAIPLALVTYAFAISATGFVDLMLSKPEVSKSFLLLALTGWILSMIFSVSGYLPIQFNTALILTGCGTFISLCLWWVANADNVKLQESNYNAETAVASELAGQGVKDGTANF
jgi:hypothetical protein